MRIVYDEISPITGEMTVLVEPDLNRDDRVKLCMKSGYQTYERLWKQDSPVIDILEQQFPMLVTESKIIDAKGNVWYKVINITQNVVLLPDLEDNKPVWRLINLMPVDASTDVSSAVTLVVQDEAGNQVLKVLDPTSSEVFDDLDFETAYGAFMARSAQLNAQ
jgi:hypothetical protein